MATRNGKSAVLRVPKDLRMFCEILEIPTPELPGWDIIPPPPPMFWQKIVSDHLILFAGALGKTQLERLLLLDGGLTICMLLLTCCWLGTNSLSISGRSSFFHKLNNPFYLLSCRNVTLVRPGWSYIHKLFAVCGTCTNLGHVG